jgi:hypothetical protein
MEWREYRFTGGQHPVQFGSRTKFSRRREQERVVMETWVRAVVEAIHSSRAQAVIYLAGGASQVRATTSPPPFFSCSLPRDIPTVISTTYTAAGARLAPLRARRVRQRPRGRRALLQGLHGPAARQGKSHQHPNRPNPSVRTLADSFLSGVWTDHALMFSCPCNSQASRPQRTWRWPRSTVPSSFLDQVRGRLLKPHDDGSFCKLKNYLWYLEM